MTQRRAQSDEGAVKVGVYDTPGARTKTTAIETDTKPTDLIRWGPILGGLFAALATLITLGTLGLAIGLNAYDPNAPLGNYGIGAGIWGAITALIAFFVGGWVAARSAAFDGRTSGIFNGAMVWFVAIPLLIYMLGSGVGALARTAGGVASTVAETAGAAAGAAAANPAVQATAGAVADNPAAQATAGTVVDQAQATAQAVVDNVSAQDVDNAAATAGNAAWGVLLSLGLAAAASILGGYVGARPRDTTVVRTTV
jgi:hypothetical protein